MSLKLGGSKSKTTTTSNTSTSSTRTPIVPEWGSTLTQAVAGRIADLNRQDAGVFVAPAHGLQSQAAGAAATLTGTPWNYEGAMSLTRGVGGSDWLDRHMAAPAAGVGAPEQLAGESLLEGLDRYMSPYTRDVVDAALADYDFGAGRTRAQQDLDLAGAGAFGGSGAALTRSMTEDAILRGRAATSSNLRDQAFSRGAALSAQDADRRQQAAALNAQLGLQQRQADADLAQRDWAQRANTYLAGQDQRLRAAEQLAGLASAADANQRANIATQAEIGGVLRDVDQQQRQAPITSAQQIVAMLSGLPIGLFTGEQTTGTETGSGTSKTKGLSFGAGVSASGDLGRWKVGG